MNDIACAVFIKGDKFLLVRRAPHKTWYPNHWDLVGGHVEEGEAIEAALIREAQEEVGLTPKAFRWVAELEEPVESGDVSARYHIFAVTEWIGGNPQLLGDEHTELQWVSIGQARTLNGIAHRGYIHVLAAVTGNDAA